MKTYQRVKTDYKNKFYILSFRKEAVKVQEDRQNDRVIFQWLQFSTSLYTSGDLSLFPRTPFSV